MLVTANDLRNNCNQVKEVSILGIGKDIYGISEYDEASQTVKLINKEGLIQLKKIQDAKGPGLTHTDELNVCNNPDYFSVFLLDQLASIKNPITADLNKIFNRANLLSHPDNKSWPAPLTLVSVKAVTSDTLP